MCNFASEPEGRDHFLERLTRAIGQLRVTREAQSPADLGRELVAIRHSLDLLELEFSRVAAQFSETDEWDMQGSTSDVDWIRHNCNTTGHWAAQAISIGEQLPNLPLSEAAVERGEIGRAHLALMARTAAKVMESIPFDEHPLLEKAKTLSPGRFKFACDHVRHAADAMRFLDEHVDATEKRRLELLTCEDGMVALRGLFDSVDGATLRTVLQPLAKPMGVGDIRTREQRWADALTELAHHGLDAGVAPSIAQQRPHLNVSASVETLMGSREAPAGELEHSAPIPSTTVQRLACDSSLSRILLDADSVVIDVGRARRIASSATRRALEARDKGCVWPGCERPPSWTAAHHLRHWAHGGATDLENLALICHRHHRMLHEHGWQLVRNADGDMAVKRPAAARSPGLTPAA